MTTHSTTDEQAALSWFLFQAEGMDLGDAEREAAATVEGLLTFAAEWDEMSDAMLIATHAPCLADCPTPVECASARECLKPRAPETPAGRKAQYHLGRGLDVVRGAAGWLIPSGSRAGVVHFVSDAGNCSCEAARAGKACWHQEAAHLVSRRAA